MTIKRIGYIVISKDNVPQGMDMNSGGPYDTDNISLVKLWRPNEKVAAETYVELINYGNKGYQLVTCVLTLELNNE